MNKMNSLLNIVNEDILMDMVQEVNGWDNSLEFLQYIHMDEFDDYLEGFSPTDIANRIHYGMFNPNDTYFRFNAYANLESYTSDEVIDELENYKEDIVERFMELYEEGHVNIWHEEAMAILDSEEEEEA